MKKAFIICGPETSGTRLSRQCFLKAGVQEIGFDMGHATEVFEHTSHLLLMKQNESVFARRSVPHGRSAGKPVEMLPIAKYHIGFIRQGFEPHWIIPIRNFFALAMAKRRKKRKGDYNPWQMMTDQYNHIFKGLIDTGAKYYFFNVSALMFNPERELKGLSLWTGIDFPVDPIKELLYDADKKYYEDADR